MRASALATALCVGLIGCGDSLVDHDALGLIKPDGGGNSDAGSCPVESVSSCGPDCLPCPAIANATPSCVTNACAYECDPGWLRSATGCSRAAAIAAGGDTTCAIVQSGEVRCWGASDHGQLGAGATAAFSRVPVSIAGISGATAIAVGASHACALTPGGVFCWGANDLSQLGGSSLSQAVPDLSSIGALAAGLDHTCAIAAGALRCWGANGAGQLGSGTTSTAEAQPSEPFSSGTTAIVSGSRHACAIQSTKLFCWGEGTSGQLGKGLLQSSSAPIQPNSISNPAVITAGGAHSCVAFASGGGGGGGSSNLSCWGANATGQLGIGSTSQQSQPAKVNLLGVQAVAAGASHTCALVAGAVLCWGANDKGQVGSGTDPQVTAPAAVTGK